MRANRILKAALVLAALAGLAVSCRAAPTPISTDAGGTATAVSAETLYADANLTVDCQGTYNLLARGCTGVDGNAYRTVNAAIAAAKAGDTIEVRQGEYRESVRVPNGSTASFFIGKSLTLQSYSGENVLLTYDSSHRPDDGHGNIGSVVTINATNVTLQGFQITGTRALGDNGQGDTGVDSDVTVFLNNGASGSILSNRISDNGHAGVKFATLGGALVVQGNIIGPGGFAARDHGIYAAPIADNNSKRLLDNEIFGESGYGIHIYGSGRGADAIHDLTISGNFLHDNLTGGLLLVGNNHLVTNNRILNNRGGPNQRGGVTFFHYGLSGLTFRGNTITGNFGVGGKPADIDCQLDAGTEYAGNDFSGNYFGFTSGGGTICQQWEAQQGQTPQPSTVTPSLTATATASPSPTGTPTSVPFTVTPTITPSPTSTPAPSMTSTPTLTAYPTFTPTAAFPPWECQVLGVTPEAANKFIVVTECDP